MIGITVQVSICIQRRFNRSAHPRSQNSFSVLGAGFQFGIYAIRFLSIALFQTIV